MTCIDHIRLNLECFGHEDPTFVAARDWIHSVAKGEWKKIYENDGHTVGKSFVKSHPKGSTTMGRQALPSGGGLAVRYGYSAKKWWVWYWFNPAKCLPDELSPHFSVLLGDGYRELKKKALVHELHVAVDVDHVEYLDYGFVDSRLWTADPAYSAIGSTYLGSKLGQRSVCCYDKAKQLEEEEGQLLGHPRLRLEMIVHPKLAAAHVHQLANPFLTFYVAELESLRTSTDSRLAEMRAAACSGKPIYGAFHALAKKRKVAVLGALAEMRPEWADPVAIWASLPQAFAWEEAVMEAAC